MIDQASYDQLRKLIRQGVRDAMTEWREQYEQQRREHAEKVWQSICEETGGNAAKHKCKLLNAFEELPVHDPETAHDMADKLLIEFIDDDEITDAFNAVPKWYA